MNNNKNKKKSISYQDYKYVYTGHKDYCKKHNIKTNEKKETINHDHRFKFDFNNPNEHYHDYSFDFNNPNEHYHDYSFDFSQENKKSKQQNKIINNKKYEKSSNTNKQTLKYKSTNPTIKTYSTSHSKNNSSSKKDNSDIKVIILILLIFMVLPFIVVFINIFSNILNESNNDSYYYEDSYYNEDYNYEDNYQINKNYNDIDENTYYYDNYEKVINYLCTDIRIGSINYLKDRITKEELSYNSGQYWISKINAYSAIDKTNLQCIISKDTKLEKSELTDLEKYFDYHYNSKINLTEGRNITVKLIYGNNQQYSSYISNIDIGRINNKWYIIN